MQAKQQTIELDKKAKMKTRGFGNGVERMASVDGD